MATYIQTDELNGTLVPTNAKTVPTKDGWGIDNLLQGFIVQSESISEERIYDTTQDQKGAVVHELDYDAQFNLTLTVIGPASLSNAPILGSSSTVNAGDTAFTYQGHKWKIRSVQYNGSYNAKKQYTITAVRFANWPSAS